MKRLSKDKRDKIILVAGCTVVISVLIWFFVIDAFADDLKKVGTKIKDESAKVDRGEREKQMYQKNIEEYNSIRRYLQKEEGTLASGDIYTWMVQTLNLFKQPYAVEIPQVAREVPCEVGVFATFPYKAASCVVRGTACYHDLGKFIADFENRFPYMRIQNLDIESGSLKGELKPEESSERLQFKFEIVTLIKPSAP